MTTDYDTIIVGGGSAGCVLANRLTADGTKTVLLLEAGPDIRDGEVPEQILDSFAARAFLDHRWLWNDLTASSEAGSDDSKSAPRKRRRYEQARVLGGGSSINGQLANRGSPADYDEWEDRGAKGWNWATCLPYFRKLERDVDFNGPLHGDSGPMPIRRIFPSLWAEHAKAMAAGFEALGFKYVPDQNGPFEDGYHPFAITNLYDRRVPVAIAYLGPAIRLRSNLNIITDTTVSELLFDGTRCIGVTAVSGESTSQFTAREIIVACGAINTPPLLLRAGIGPAAHLREHGIPVRVDRSGVGRGLTDHPAIAIGAFVRPHARLNAKTRRHLLVGLRFSSGITGAPQGDMAVSVSTKAAWHAVGEQISSITMWVNKTFSDKGEVKLNSPDWRDPPRVDFNLLQDRRDLERLKIAFRLLSGVFQVPAVQAAVEDPFPAAFTDKVRQVSVINRKNATLTGILAKLLDGPAWLRRRLMRQFIVDGPTLDELLADDARLESFIREAAFGVWHASCTCRMGAVDDINAVTDADGNVYGVSGLRVVDASLFPAIPSANVHLTVLMVAEKIADRIIGGH